MFVSQLCETEVEREAKGGAAAAEGQGPALGLVNMHNLHTKTPAQMRARTHPDCLFVTLMLSKKSVKKKSVSQGLSPL